MAVLTLALEIAVCIYLAKALGEAVYKVWKRITDKEEKE